MKHLPCRLTTAICFILIAGHGGVAAAAGGESAGMNLLRNSKLQDDWLTGLPELKTLSWNYVMDFYNRRDFNPDGWLLRGGWTWENADKPLGQRRFILAGPQASMTQEVNAWCIHDPQQREGFPDAGGYPKLIALQSPAAKQLLRDLRLRVRLRGWDVPEGAASMEASWVDDTTDSSASVSTGLPAGTFDWREIDVTLPAKAWWDREAKDKNEASMPALARVALRYVGDVGHIEIESVELLASEPASPNLLPNGGFERVKDQQAPDDSTNIAEGWSGAQKYRYFPPGYYYMFGTWHNAPFDNRGVADVDELIVDRGRQSLKMIVPAGDEMAVESDPIPLNQEQPRLLEVFARVKTEQLCMLQIDAVDQDGERIDCFNFIHKQPVSIGSDDWRLVRTVLRPGKPVRSLRLKLCARGVNGHCLGGTGLQPQNNVVGLVWWDNVRVFEPESTKEELQARGVATIDTDDLADGGASKAPQIRDIRLGERLFGENTLSARVHNAGKAGTYSLHWRFVSPSGAESTFDSEPQQIPAGETAILCVPYVLSESCPRSYTEYRGDLTLLDDAGKSIASSQLWLATWTTPIDLELGAAYLQPDQRQLARMNFGFTAASMARAASVRLDIVRRATGQVIASQTIPATPEAIERQRRKIPAALREDFNNLLLTDIDVSKLPLQPFDDPQRNWVLRVALLDQSGKTMASVDSVPFCRLAHDTPQPPVKNVHIDENNLLHVNDRPWMPWGVTYGFTPVYDGPADPGEDQYRDLQDLPAFSIYDRHGANRADRPHFDLNCYRYVAAAISPTERLQSAWKEENIYASSAFVVPHAVFSVDELNKNAGGAEKLAEYLKICRSAPMVVSTAPGIEEAFGLFVPAKAEAIDGLHRVTDLLRERTGKPVMVGHGGYWNRFEFEKVPFFDIFDPETEPFYPAPLHVELMPLVEGKPKAVWLRPQMYEQVPYERWRYHCWVEMMRGARGWQMAHGPGDASTFRGLHGEMKYIAAAAYSHDRGPKLDVDPWIEHWSRRHDDKLYIVAATTHGLTTGDWRWKEIDDGDVEHEKDQTDNITGAGPGSRARITGRPHQLRDESNAGGLTAEPFEGPRMHCIQWLPDARKWPAGSKLVQWVRLDADSPPSNVVLIAKCDGRWSRAAAWGSFDVKRYRSDLELAHWFLRAFYRHSSGFLGWDNSQTAQCLQFLPAQEVSMGELPTAGKWMRLEVPLEKIGATGVLLDGVGFLHEGGVSQWGRTSLLDAEGKEQVVWGDQIGLPAKSLENVRLAVDGLKAGTKIRVVFEDRELVAGNGQFADDFRGRDLYERFGGGPYAGYGDTPVALHVYEMALP